MRDINYINHSHLAMQCCRDIHPDVILLNKKVLLCFVSLRELPDMMSAWEGGGHGKSDAVGEVT